MMIVLFAFFMLFDTMMCMLAFFLAVFLAQELLQTGGEVTLVTRASGDDMFFKPIRNC